MKTRKEKEEMERMNTRVSVIVPVEGTEQFLPECLEDLVSQTLEEVEILVISTGSADCVQAVIDDFAVRYPSKIRPFAMEGGCTAEVIDFGIARASGDFIGFVRGGDRVEADMYEKMYVRAVETGAEIVCCTGAQVERGTVTKKYLSKKERFFGKSVVESPNILKYAKTAFWNKLYQRGFLLRGGYRFFSGDSNRDAVVKYEVLMDANQVVCVDRPLYYHVKQEKSEAAPAEELPEEAEEQADAEAAAEDETPQGTGEDQPQQTAEESGGTAELAEGSDFNLFERCDNLLAALHSRFDPDDAEELYEWAASLCMDSIFSRLNKLSRGRDWRKLQRFAAKAYDYLEQHFPSWREHPALYPAGRGLSPRLKSLMLRHRGTARLYYGVPRPVKRGLRSIAKKAKRLKRLFKKNKKKRPPAKRKRSTGSPYNIELLEWTQQLLLQIGVTAFADFSSMREILRQGEELTRLPAAELGIMVSNRQEISRIRVFLEAQGMQLRRQYVFAGRAVKESYGMGPGSMSLYYYQREDSCERVWLPYKMPDYIYEERGRRHLLELTSPPIGEMEAAEIGGHRIVIPRNAAQLVEERYGGSWSEIRTAIGLDSPSVRLLDDFCRCISYQYTNHACMNEEWFQRINRYSLSLLKTLHGQYVTMLTMVDQICRENHLTWYLGEGSLLGAMRHHGFIPWDDDVDILMPKADYDAFIRIAPQKIGKQYMLEHYSTKPKTPWIYAKIRLIGDCDFACGNLFRVSNEFGPNIDIFPLYTTSQPYGKKQKIQKRRLARYRRMLQYKAGVSTPKKRAYKKWKVLSMFLPASFLHKRAEAMLQPFQEEGDYFANFMSRYSLQKQIFPKDYYGTPRYIEFEDIELPVPQRAEEILCSIYGPDWHQLPEHKVRTVKHGMLHRNEKNRYESIVIR